MNDGFEIINNALAEWDPIGVGKNIAMEEYRGYVPSILKVIEDKQRLRYCLEDILMNRLRLEYDPDNEEHLLDLQSVCDRLMEVYQASCSQPVAKIASVSDKKP